MFHPGDDAGAKKAAAKPNVARRETLADQRQAAAIYRWHEGRASERGASLDEVRKMAGRGVCFCGWTQIAETETALMRVRRKEGWHAYISGIETCGLRWVCPVCTHRRGEEDRKTVNDGLAAARERPGLYPVMLTLTTRHQLRELAKDVLEGVLKAEQRLKRLRVWQRLSDRLVGYARVLEWTYGKNGHHPHFHTILLVEAGTEAEAIAQVQSLQPAYMRQLEKVGRDGTTKAAWDRSFQVQGAAAASQYVTKWGMAEELTGSKAKESATPWVLLRRSRTAETEAERERAAGIWWEIMQATKGRAQLYKSEGWRRLVEEWRSGQEGEEEPEPELQEVDRFGIRERGKETPAAWCQARTRTLAIREAAEAEEDLAAARLRVRDALVNGTLDDSLTKGVVDDEDQVLDDIGDVSLRPNLKTDEEIRHYGDRIKYGFWVIGSDEFGVG